MPREEREHVRDGVPLDDPLPRDVGQEHEPHAELRRERREPLPLRPGARERDHEAGLSRRGCRPHQRVEALLGREPRDGEDDDVVGIDARLGAERVPPRRERVRRLGEPSDVDRVGDDRDAVVRNAARTHRLARQRSDDEHLGGAADDRRHDRVLHGPPPAWPGVALVRLDEEHVGDAVPPTPGDRCLRGERAPARDDDDVGVGVP